MWVSICCFLPPPHLPQVHTCPPAMGYSFAAGTIDGPGAFDFTQGTSTVYFSWFVSCIYCTGL